MDSQTLDPQRQDQAKEYARTQRKYMLLELFTSIGILCLWILSGLSIQLRDWVYSWTGNPWLAVFIFGGVFGLTFTLLDLPLSFHTGYTLPPPLPAKQPDKRKLVGRFCEKLFSFRINRRDCLGSDLTAAAICSGYLVALGGRIFAVI